MLFILLTIKRIIEQWIMFPFVWYGKHIAKPLDGTFDIICFFPNPAVGGAEKVNAEFLLAFPEKRIMVFFTKKPSKGNLLALYELPHVTILDISRWTDNKKKYWQSFIWRGTCAALANRQSKSLCVFIGQCNFGYKLLPHLKKGIRRIELIHVSEKKFAWITFPFIALLDARVTVGKSIRDAHLEYYQWLGVPEKYNLRWHIILYSVPFLHTMPPERNYQPIKCYYAGRGSYQKRLWLLFDIIRKTIHLPVEWHLAGPFQDEIPDDILSYIIYHGIINGQEAMYDLHRKMDVLVMTSAFEGFPVVIMEAMANGVVPLCTAVDAIPEHITDGENGMLMLDPSDEKRVIDSGVQKITQFCHHPEQLHHMSANAAEYALQHFSRERFVASYRNLVLKENEKQSCNI